MTPYDHLDLFLDVIVRGELDLDFVLRKVSKRLIEKSLTANGGNQCKTAEKLHIHRNTLARQMKVLGIPTKTGRRNGA